MWRRFFNGDRKIPVLIFIMKTVDYTVLDFNVLVRDSVGNFENVLSKGLIATVNYEIGGLDMLANRLEICLRTLRTVVY